MPITSFESLPDTSRVWVYGADRDITGAGAQRLLGETDAFLAQWKAHGVDLTSARDWSRDRFLTIAVDQEQEGASGCSIDVLFRALKSLERELDAKLVTSGLVYYRGRDGRINSVTRDEFTEASERGDVDGDTEVFDLSVTTLAEWRGRFSSKAADSWHASLMSEPAA
jgi:hypothetical protein